MLLLFLVLASFFVFIQLCVFSSDKTRLLAQAELDKSRITEGKDGEAGASSPLFNISAISEQLLNPLVPALSLIDQGQRAFSLYAIDENQKLFDKYPLLLELYKNGLPIITINSLLRCGVETSDTITKSCDCGEVVYPLAHRCNNRSCPYCSKTRSRRLERKYLPMLQNCPVTRGSPKSLYLITISPENYTDSKIGYKEIKSSWKKFFRSKYVKERVDAGFWVIETKTKNKFGECKGWNIHIHALFYGRRLDNVIRGTCKCGQSFLKFDEKTGGYYCANKKCLSFDVIPNGDSKIVKIFKEVSNRDCVIDVKELDSIKSALKYVLKYVSSNKDDFASISDQAEYMCRTHRKKLINVFGEFFKFRPTKHVWYCKDCHKPVQWLYKRESERILETSALPPPDREEIKIEVIKI